MMNQAYREKDRLLAEIHEGKRVYDWDNDYVGRVRYVQFPSELSEEASASDDKQLAHIPLDFRKQLVREGFIQVGGGLFSPDYYVLASQIAAVVDEAVSLNVLKVEITRF